MAPSPDIVKRFQSGDHAALEQLFRDESPRLGRFLRRYVASAEAAEDLLQDIWLQAWNSRSQLRQPERFVSWFYRIARNTIFQASRQKQRRVKLTLFGEMTDESGKEAAPDPIDPQPGPREQAEQAQFRALLEAEVARLKPPAPEILTLRYGAGFGLREIAEMLDIPLGSVCSVTSRSLKVLKSKLHFSE